MRNKNLKQQLFLYKKEMLLYVFRNETHAADELSWAINAQTYFALIHSKSIFGGSFWDDCRLLTDDGSPVAGRLVTEILLKASAIKLARKQPYNYPSSHSGSKPGRSKVYRHPKTYQEKKMAAGWRDNCEPKPRPARTAVGLPSARDELFKFSYKNWKSYRKTQRKTSD